MAHAGSSDHIAGRTPLKVLGFMTGTSLDAIDMAVLTTDGETIVELGATGEVKLDQLTRSFAEKAIADALTWPREQAEPASFDPARILIARAHIAAAATFFAVHPGLRETIDLVGVHGQTVLHEAPSGGCNGRSIQLIDADLLASGLEMPVAHDFRAVDIAAGGQGAPLAPVYHAALVRCSRLPVPLAVLNLGGVANITLIRTDGTFLAFDAGPANGMIDQLVQLRTGERMDWGGQHARAGNVHHDIVEKYLGNKYSDEEGAKSLDRFQFSIAPVASLSLSDAAATLTAFAASAIAVGLRSLPERPLAVIVSGGGRHNPVLLDAIRSASGMKLTLAEEVGWRGDSVEAEAFAFLAARVANGLPLSFPETTGVPKPTTGGRIARPRSTDVY